MPMYDYECPLCGEVIELVVAYEERDLPRVHSLEQASSDCAGVLAREKVTAFSTADPAPKMGAVMYDGERKVGHAEGHFGKTAKRRRKK